MRSLMWAGDPMKDDHGDEHSVERGFGPAVEGYHCKGRDPSSSISSISVEASTARTIMDAGALDDLDLDDMFADDNDMLFEGLDIDVAGMGDIINVEKKEDLPAPRPRGPRTKRPPPPDDEYVDVSTTKRRKTKRKSKVPIAFGDDDDEYFDETQPKKKSRKSVANRKGKAVSPANSTNSTSKKKKTKKGTTIDAAATSTSKKGTASGIPPPGSLMRGSSATVAAAGQFGGRQKRGSSSTLPKVKRKSKSSSVVGDGFGGLEGGLQATFVPKTESTYGGLHPSKTHFYPFMESLPPEPSMKQRKQFPVIDKLAAALVAQLSAASLPGVTQPKLDAAIGAGVTMDSPVVQLLLESFEAVSEKEKAAFTELKRQGLWASIPQLREIIQSQDQNKILGDLYTMCGLLTRQYNFIRTSLTNMETWCRANFEDADYRSAYSLPEPFQPEKVGTIITSANRRWKKPVVAVKLVFSGHKEPKSTSLSTGLFAKLPQAVVIASDKKKDSSGSLSSALKKKKKSTSSSSIATAVKVTSAPKSYADCPPAERRQRILEKVSQLALGLESQLSRRTRRVPPLPIPLPAGNSAGTTSDKAKASAKTSTATATSIPVEDPPLHTARMWEWLEAAGFFHTRSSRELDLSLQAPEIHPRGIFLPTPSYIRGRADEKRIPKNKLSKSAPQESEELQLSMEDEVLDLSHESDSQRMVADEEGDVKSNTKSTEPAIVSAASLYDRLQSLLVLEDETDDESDAVDGGEGSDSDSDSDSDEDSYSFLEDDEYLERDENDSQEIQNTLPLADLSLLSVEERTFLHLRRIGLIKNSIFPEVEFVLEVPGSKNDDSDKATIEDDLVNVVGSMSADLSALTARNNARISYLDLAMDPSEATYRKQLEEAQASLITKCQNLLKRTKTKKSQSKKSQNSATAGSNGSSKDDLNLPW